MSVLQQLSAHTDPPEPPFPPGGMPGEASFRHQSTEQAGSSPHPALLWPDQSPVFPEYVFADPSLRSPDELQVAPFFSSTASSLPGWIRALGGAGPVEQHTEEHFTPVAVSNQGFLGGSAESTLEHTYVLDDRPAIQAFMKRNRLLGHLLDARAPLISAFGEATVKRLSLVEDDDGFVTLFCFVLVPGGLDEARWALDSFDESWWLGRSPQAAGKLNFDFELI